MFENRGRRIVWGDGLSQRDIIQNMDGFISAIQVPDFARLEIAKRQNPTEGKDYGNGRMVLDLSGVNPDETHRHIEEIAGFTLIINNIAANYGGMPIFNAAPGQPEDVWSYKNGHFSQEFVFQTSSFHFE